MEGGAGGRGVTGRGVDKGVGRGVDGRELKGREK